MYSGVGNTGQRYNLEDKQQPVWLLLIGHVSIAGGVYVQDEHHVLFTCPVYKSVCNKYSSHFWHLAQKSPNLLNAQ